MTSHRCRSTGNRDREVVSVSPLYCRSCGGKNPGVCSKCDNSGRDPKGRRISISQYPLSDLPVTDLSPGILRIAESRSYPDRRVSPLGTSATPVRPEGMVDTVDLYFEGNLFYELTLPQAWYYHILPVPKLVQSAFGLDNELDRIQRNLDRSGCSARRRERIQKKLDLARVDFKGALGAPSVIRKFLPESVRKLLVFCRDLADLRQMVPEVCDWLTQAGRSITPFEIHHAQSEQENRRLLAAFREESDRLHVLFSVNMLIEGLHVEGVMPSCSCGAPNLTLSPCNS